MFLDPEDILVLLIAVAPVFFLAAWLMHTRSRVRVSLVILSIALFVLFLPFTVFSIAYLFVQFMPWLTESATVYDAARIVVTVVPVVCLLLICTLLYRRIRER